MISKLYTGFNHSPLSAYKSEATMFGLTEIQARLFVCFHRVISQNFITFSLTFLITFLTIAKIALLELLCLACLLGNVF